MSSQEMFYTAIAEYLREQGMGVDRVTSVEEVQKSDGYCDTCYNEWIEVEINYFDTLGTPRSYGYYGSLTEMIASIT